MERVVVRRARAGDAAARAEVLRDAYLSLTTDAFFYFFFHEVTLQGAVLLGAFLFIFLSAGSGALLALPGAAALVLAGARLAHERAGARAAAATRREHAGWVAERRGAPHRPPPAQLAILFEDDAPHAEPQYSQVVGTVSLSACQDAAGGWLQALGVRRAWRRRGLGRALLRAARAGAEARASPALHALVSALQPAARELLHDAGWEVGGGYSRPLLGAALTLPLVRLELSLAPA